MQYTTIIDSYNWSKYTKSQNWQTVLEQIYKVKLGQNWQTVLQQVCKVKVKLADRLKWLFHI